MIDTGADSPAFNFRFGGLKASLGAVFGGKIFTVRTPFPDMPNPFVADALHTLVPALKSRGAVKLGLLKRPPFVHVIIGGRGIPLSSLTVKCETSRSPALTCKVEGLKLSCGGVLLSVGLMTTRKIALATLPTSSLAVAVHILMVSALTAGAFIVLSLIHI